ncbi:hypothetical protein GCM10011400_61240 [Paraburkholderia caffeinilytica]|uniref:LysR substrate-binding domain-containing protein n=1 Tax=Paraburkholderia caffeinilytica TaxID=1761016 RepID=A0ABQ1NB29_9BURK|nr:hypothetical protein GCM10011400_61240 [Paraburkholderia caffeinilytica]
MNAIVPRKCLIACVDELSSFLVPAITAEILGSSEHTTVEFKSMDSSEVFEELGSGRLDTAIVSGFETCSTGQEFLGNDELVCLMSDENRLSRQSYVSSAEYGQSNQVVLASNIRKPQPALDVVLRNAGLWRRNTIAVPFVDVIPHLLERSDLLFTTTRKFGEHYAALLPLHIGRIDVTLPNVTYYQITSVAARDPLRVGWVAAKVRLACAPRFADAEVKEK